MVEGLLFVVVALVALAGAVTVVAARNPIHSALGLLGTLLAMAVLYVMQLAHLVAAVQVIVYAGAVLTLFLFVIMLIGVDKEERREEPLPYQRWVVGGVSLVIIVFAIVVIGGMGSVFGSIVTALGIGVIEGLTKVFYSEASTTIIFVVMALVLLLRPRGLFGREGSQ